MKRKNTMEEYFLFLSFCSSEKLCTFVFSWILKDSAFASNIPAFVMLLIVFVILPSCISVILSEVEGSRKLTDAL